MKKIGICFFLLFGCTFFLNCFSQSCFGEMNILSGNVEICDEEYSFQVWNIIDLSPCSDVYYEWNFGDGSPLQFGDYVSHTYDNEGNYTITLTLYCDKEIKCVTTMEVQIICNRKLCFEQPDDFSGVSGRRMGNDILAYGNKFFLVGNLMGGQLNRMPFTALYFPTSLTSATSNWRINSEFNNLFESDYDQIRIQDRGESFMTLAGMNRLDTGRKYFILSEWAKQNGDIISYDRFEGFDNNSQYNLEPYDFTNPLLIQNENVYPIVGAISKVNQQSTNIFVSIFDKDDYSTLSRQFGYPSSNEVGKVVLTYGKNMIVLSEKNIKPSNDLGIHIMKLDPFLNVLDAKLASLGPIFCENQDLQQTSMRVNDATFINGNLVSVGSIDTYLFDQYNSGEYFPLIQCFDPENLEVKSNTFIDFQGSAGRIDKILYSPNKGIYIVGSAFNFDGLSTGFVAKLIETEGYNFDIDWIKVAYSAESIPYSVINGVAINDENLILTGAYFDEFGNSNILNIVTDFEASESCCLYDLDFEVFSFDVCQTDDVLNSSKLNLNVASNMSFSNALLPDELCQDDYLYDFPNRSLTEFSVLKALSIFPNPSNGMFRISLVEDDYEDIKSYRVYDLDGVMVYSKEMGGDSDKQIIDLNMSEFSSGIYLVELRTTKDNIYRDKISLMK